jgi:hypothetical protein
MSSVPTDTDPWLCPLSVYFFFFVCRFVASGDVPHIPYQTRLDTFMNFSFFMVAVILFIHGSLYYFREDDEDEDEKEGSKKEGETPKHVSREVSARPVQIDMSKVVQDQGSNGNNPVYVNSPPEDISHLVVVSSGRRPSNPSHKPSAVHSIEGTNNPPRRHWLVEWYAGLVWTRKNDVVWIVVLILTYTIGVAIILGAPAASSTTALQASDSLPPL